MISARVVVGIFVDVRHLRVGSAIFRFSSRCSRFTYLRDLLLYLYSHSLCLALSNSAPWSTRFSLAVLSLTRLAIHRCRNRGAK